MVSRKRVELQAAIGVADEAGTQATIAAHAIWMQMQGASAMTLPPKSMSVRIAKRLAALYPVKTPIGNLRGQWALDAEQAAEELGLAIDEPAEAASGAAGAGGAAVA